MKPCIRILHLEDNRRDVAMVADLLDSAMVSCEIYLAAGRKQFEAALEQPDPDVILCDYNLPGFDGLSALKLAKEKLPEVPVIIVSGVIGAEEAVECLKAGATDYLLKQRLERLPSAVRRSLEEAEGQRQRKRAEEALHHLNADLERRVRDRTAELQSANATLANFKAALDEHAIVAIADAAGTITYVNDKLCAIAKHDRADLLGKGADVLNRESHSKVFLRGLFERITNGRVWHGELRNRAKDGSPYWLSATIVPFPGDDGRPSQYIAICSDISASKQAAVTLAEQSVRLEVLLNEVREAKTLVLRNDKLVSLGRMCAGLIHEINNPLNYASQGLFLLGGVSKDLPEERRAEFLETLDDVQEGVARVVRIISDLRGFTSRTEDHSRIFQLKPVVERLLLFFSHEFKAGVNIEVDVPEALALRGDSNQVTQVLVNLMQNALDAVRAKHYEGDTSPKISITAGSTAKGVLVKIRDNGRGIAPEIMGSIFDPFFTTRAVGSGIGLGLTISHRIMAQYGGGIDVQSELGAHSEFTLMFPPAGPVALSVNSAGNGSMGPAPTT